MPTAEMLRTFVAVPLSQPLHAGLARAQRDLQRLCPVGAVRWVKTEGIHLTLFFLGETPSARVADIERVLTPVAQAAQPLQFTVGGVGAFPNLTRPNVIWVGVRDTAGTLTPLHRAVNAALASLGFQPEDRAFTPHLTLGRVNRDSGSDVVRRVGEAVGRFTLESLGEESPRQIVLFRSELRPTGAEYTALRVFPLGQG